MQRNKMYPSDIFPLIKFIGQKKGWFFMNKNELTVFKNTEFGEVRTIIRKDEPWFVAGDIATILDFSKTANMLDSLDEDEKWRLSYSDSVSIGLENVNSQGMYFINESGLYSAILRSRKPEAKYFKKWVTSEVLPSIHKYGTYMTEEVIEKTLTDPDFIIQLATQLKEEKIKRIEAEKKIEEQKPLVGFAETALKSKDNILVRQVAKIAQDEGIDIGEKKLYNKLRNWKLIMPAPSTEPYQSSMNAGYFVVEENNIDTPYGIKLSRTTKVTPKGQIYIIEKLKKESLN